MTISLPAPEDSNPAPPEEPPEERRQYFDSGIKYGTGGPSRSVAPPWWHSSQTPGHWRRFFARLLDDMLYGCLIAAFNMLVLRINPAREEALDGLVSWLLRCLLLFAAQAMWGVIRQFFAPSSGLPPRIGSVSTTSRPAPATFPESSARRRAASSTSGPLDVLIR